MKKGPGKITDMESLQREKQRLQIQVITCEAELKAHAGLFRNHYGSIIWSSLNPFKDQSGGSVVGIITKDLLPLLLGIGTASDHSEISQALAKGIQNVVMNAGSKVMKKVFRKDSKKNEQPT